MATAATSCGTPQKARAGCARSFLALATRVTFGRVLAAVTVAGAVAGAVTQVAPGEAVAAALSVASVLIVLPRGVALRVAVALLVGVLSCAYAARARDRALAPPLVVWFAAVTGRLGAGRAADVVWLDGVIDRDAEPTDGEASLLVRVARVRDAGGWHDAPGRVQMHVAGAQAGHRLTEWTAGRRIRAPAGLRAPTIARNPGGPSERWVTLRRRFDLLASVKSAALVEVERGAWWDEAAAAVRRYVRRTTSRFVGPRDPTSAAIVSAVLIGDRAGLTDEVTRRLQAAGTYHVIAISGGNVALVIVLTFAVFRQVVRSFRVVTLGTLVVVMAYGWLVGGDPSVVRSVTAASVYLLMSLGALAPAAIDVLGVVSLLVIAWSPLTVIDVGAWLSFGATFSIILCAERFFVRARARTSSRSSWIRRLWVAAIALGASTLAAEVALMPVSASVFARVGIAGLALNFIAIPAMAIVQIAGMLVLLLAPAWTSGASGAAWIVHGAATALTESARLAEIIPGGSWRAPPVSWAWTVVFYASGLLLLRDTLPRAARWTAASTAALALGVIVSSPFTCLAQPPRGWLRVTMIDVGQGDAVLLQLPGGRALLVDAGGAPGSFDVGDRVVTPALWALGVRRLDWFLFTHADLDHLGGARAIVANFRPREIWEGVPVPRDALRQNLLAIAARDAIAWRQLQTNDVTVLGDVTIDVRHPPRPAWERQRVRNDDSVVLRVSYRDVEVLLTGDAGTEAEAALAAELAEASVPARLRVLKVGHHGSRTSTSEALMRVFRPDVALISAGRGNLFGHPAPDVVARLQQSGAMTLRTDRDGAITIETDGAELRVQTLTHRWWTWRMTHVAP